MARFNWPVSSVVMNWWGPPNGSLLKKIGCLGPGEHIPVKVQ